MTRLHAAPAVPTLSWDDLQIPLPPLPPMPDLSFLPGLPDFWGTPMQWLVAVPALTALAVITLSGRSNRLGAWLGVGGGLVTFLAALWQLVVLVRVDGRHTSGSIGALPLGELSVPLGLQVDWPLGLVAVAVALVALVVQVYGRWYLWYDPRYTVFAATVAAFTAAMMLTVLADDVLLLLVGWEVMGWCSYLLIGHHSTRAAARRAALKALLVTRTADVGVVLGLVVLAAGARTTSLTGIVEHWTGVAGAAAEPGSPGPTLTAAMVLLVVGVAGKSALFPFQDWLPDAMEGPTPASALIHAATMVAAGTVVLVHLFPLLAATGTARLLLAVLAAVTMLGAALLAFAQGDLKRLLAWSTVSQVALMLGALAAATPQTGPDAATQHLLAHAWFKALLFLSAGWLGVLVGGTAMAVVASGGRRYRDRGADHQGGSGGIADLARRGGRCRPAGGGKQGAQLPHGSAARIGTRRRRAPRDLRRPDRPHHVRPRPGRLLVRGQSQRWVRLASTIARPTRSVLCWALWAAIALLSGRM